MSSLDLNQLDSVGIYSHNRLAGFWTNEKFSVAGLWGWGGVGMVV